MDCPEPLIQKLEGLASRVKSWSFQVGPGRESRMAALVIVGQEGQSRVCLYVNAFLVVEKDRVDIDKVNKTSRKKGFEDKSIRGECTLKACGGLPGCHTLFVEECGCGLEVPIPNSTTKVDAPASGDATYPSQMSSTGRIAQLYRLIKIIKVLRGLHALKSLTPSRSRGLAPPLALRSVRLIKGTRNVPLLHTFDPLPQ